MISVFDGGDGSISGGKSERSRESGDLLPDDARERCGEGTVACMFAIMDVARRGILYVCCVSSCGELESKAVTACVLYQSSPSGGELWFKLPHATSEQCSASIPPRLDLRPSHTRVLVPCLYVFRAFSGFLGVIALPPSLLLNAQCVKESPDLGGLVNQCHNAQCRGVNLSLPDEWPPDTQPHEDEQNVG